MTPLEIAASLNLCARILGWTEAMLVECDEMEKKCYGEDVDVRLTVALLKNALVRDRRFYQWAHDRLLEAW
jgi:hypothetical protein